MIGKQAKFRMLHPYKLLTLVICALTMGCVPIPIRPTEAMHELTGRISEPIRSGEAIAILPILSTYHIPGAEECVGEAVQKAHPQTRIITSDEFLRAAFTSYRLPTGEPARTEYIQSLLNRPLVNERLAAMGIRLVLLVESGTTTDTYSTAAKIGWGEPIWRSSSLQRSALKVTVLEFGRSGVAGEVHASAYTTSEGIAPLPPIPFGVVLLPFESTETRACAELQVAILKFLSGQEQPGGRLEEQSGSPRPPGRGATRGLTLWHRNTSDCEPHRKLIDINPIQAGYLPETVHSQP